MDGVDPDRLQAATRRCIQNLQVAQRVACEELLQMLDGHRGACEELLLLCGPEERRLREALDGCRELPPSRDSEVSPYIINIINNIAYYNIIWNTILYYNATSNMIL